MRRPAWAQRGSVARRRAATIGVIAVEVVIIGLAGAYVVTSSTQTLVAWILLSWLYLAVGWRRVRRRSLRPGVAEVPRTGISYVVAQVFPFAASLTGIFSALNVLVIRNDSSIETGERLALAVVGAFGMVIAWMMLHVGYARLYQALEQRHPEEQHLEFPGTADPLLADYLYFAFTIGSTFATSDVDVRSRRMRLRVLNHNVLSFFYNAAVIALAIQVLQQLGDA